MTATRLNTPVPPYAQSAVGGFLYYKSNGTRDWRIIYQARDGSCRGLSGDTFSQAEVLSAGQAKLGTPIVSVSHTSSLGAGSQHFYLNNSNEVCIRNIGFGNAIGPLLDPSGNRFRASSQSKLGAFCWVRNNITHVRVAYQLDSGEVQQINWDGNSSQRFTYSHKSPPTMLGTSLAFLNQSPRGEDQYFRGYYQHHSTIMELVNEPSRNYIGSFTENVPHKTVIAVTHPATSGTNFGRGKGPVSVFWVNADTTVSKRVRNNDGQWGGTQHLPSNIRVSAGCQPVVFSWVPPNAQSPVTERIIYVAPDGNLYAYQT